MNDKPELQMQVTINVMKDGRIGVGGFPTNFMQASQIMHAAHDSVMNYFIEQAKAGKLDDKGTVIESKIIQPKKPILKLNAKQHRMGPRVKKDGLYKN